MLIIYLLGQIFFSAICSKLVRKQQDTNQNVLFLVQG